MMNKANALLILGVVLSVTGLAVTATALNGLYATDTTFLWVSIIGLLVLLVGVILFMGGAVVKARLYFLSHNKMKTTFAGIFTAIGIAFVAGGIFVGNYGEPLAGAVAHPYIGYTFALILCGLASLTMGIAIFMAGDSREGENKSHDAQGVLT